MTATAAPTAVTLRDAVDAFLATPRCANPNTHRAYAGVLDRILDQLGPGRALADIADGEIGDVLEELWGTAADSTWNQRRATVASWLAWCQTKKRWPAPSVPPDCERRRDIPLREKTLWRMLYETAARAAEILALIPGVIASGERGWRRAVAARSASA